MYTTTKTLVRLAAMAVAPVLLLSFLPRASADDAVPAGEWTHFRGSHNTAVASPRRAPTGGHPTSFDAETGENVAWRVPLEDPGPSSPILVGDLVVVTTATASSSPDARLKLVAIARDDGEIRWQRRFWSTGHTSHHPFGGLAAPTPASDGERIVALYSTNDVACFDLDGNPLWLRGLAWENPRLRNDVGMGSSPRIVGDVVVVQCESEGESLVAGLDLETGRTRWRIDRPHQAIWSTPTLLRDPESSKVRVLVMGRESVVALDPTNGEVVWQFDVSCNTTASPTTKGRDVLVPANGIHALRWDPADDQYEVLWYQRLLRGSSPSPVVGDGYVYVVQPPSFLVAGEMATGRVAWKMRLEKGPFWASPVLVDREHLWVVNQEGLVQMVRLPDEARDGAAEVVGTGQLEAGALATPAVAADGVYLRTREALWRIAPTE